MSDPNYMHEFLPNRKGLCKQITTLGHCGKPEDAPVHVRWKEKEKEVTEGEENENQQAD